MKKVVLILSCLFAFACINDALAQDKKKKEKVKKEKKEYVWEMPALTGNEGFDKYLLTCDTLYNRISTYRDSVTFYHIVLDCDIDAQGDTIFNPRMIDDEGNARGTALAAMQYSDMFKTGTSLLADLVIITAETASATASLPSLGTKALSYAKYVKAGPKILSMGTSEVKDIMGKISVQRKQIRSIRKYYKTLQDKENPNAVADANKIITVELTDIPRVVWTTEQRVAADVQEKKDNEEAVDKGFDPDSDDEELI